MKKLILVAAVAAFAMTSCKKGKVSNEWTISSFEENSTYTNSSNETSTSVTKIDDKTYSNTYTPAGSTTSFTSTGTVNAMTWTINKDGSWTSTRDITYTDSDSFGSTVTTEVETASGSWDFLNGVGKDFKKGERIVFNTTSSENKTTSTYTPTGGTATTSSSSSSSTYSDGDVSMVMLITESKNKEMVMTQEGNTTWTNTSSSGSSSTSTTTKSTSNTTIKVVQK